MCCQPNKSDEIVELREKGVAVTAPFFWSICIYSNMVYRNIYVVVLWFVFLLRGFQNRLRQILSRRGQFMRGVCLLTNVGDLVSIFYFLKCI